MTAFYIFPLSVAVVLTVGSDSRYGSGQGQGRRRRVEGVINVFDENMVQFVTMIVVVIVYAVGDRGDRRSSRSFTSREPSSSSGPSLAAWECY